MMNNQYEESVSSLCTFAHVRRDYTQNEEVDSSSFLVVGNDTFMVHGRKHRIVITEQIVLESLDC